MQHHPRRFTALLVSGALLSQTVVPPVVWGSLQDRAVRGGGSSTELPAEALPSLDLEQLDLASLTVPEEAGDVVDTWQPDGETPKGLVIHLQDLHTHPTAQTNLSQLIGYLHEQLGIELIALEGAEGFCDTTLYSDLPDPPSTERIAKLFLHEGLFTGAEYYGITHPGHVTLFGVEDEVIYLEHLKVYQQGAGRLTELEDILTHLRHALAPLKASLYPNVFQRLLKLREAYERDDNNTFEPYLKELLRLAKSAKLDLARYPHLQAAAQAYELYDHLDMRQVQQDQQHLLDALRPQLTPLERRQLHRLAQSLRTNQDSSGRDYETLARIAQAHGIVLQASDSSAARSTAHTLRAIAGLLTGVPLQAPTQTDYPALSRYLTYLKLTRQLQSKTLSEDLEHLEQAIEAMYLTTDPQRTLARLLKEADLVDDLLHVKLSPGDHREYRHHASNLTTQALASALSLLDVKLPLTHAQLDELFSALPAYERFYELALKRDEALVRNTLRRLQDQPTKAAVLIAGGFHTPSLTAQLKAHDVAYVVIAPRVDADLNDSRYHAHLQRAFPTLQELIRKLDSQALGAPISSDSDSPFLIDYKIDPPLGALDQPGETRPLRKALATLVTFAGLKIRAAGSQVVRWMPQNPRLAAAGIMVAWFAGELVLRAAGIELRFAEDAQKHEWALLAMTTVSGMGAGTPQPPESREGERELPKERPPSSSYPFGAVPRPLTDNPVNQEQAEQWIQAHPTPALRALLRFVLSRVTHVTQGEFEQALADTVADFSARVTTPYLLILSEDSRHHSEEWVYALARERGLRPAVDVATPSTAAAVLRRHKGIVDFVYIDDAAFSTEHSQGVIEDVLEGTASRSLRVHILIPFMTTDAARALRRLSTVEIYDRPISARVYRYRRMKTFPELTARLRGNRRQLARRLTDELFGHYPADPTLTYFQHKVPDGLSFFEHLAQGNVINEAGEVVEYGAYQVIPETTPPYVAAPDSERTASITEGPAAPGATTFPDIEGKPPGARGRTDWVRGTEDTLVALLRQVTGRPDQEIRATLAQVAQADPTTYPEWLQPLQAPLAAGVAPTDLSALIAQLAESPLKTALLPLVSGAAQVPPEPRKGERETSEPARAAAPPRISVLRVTPTLSQSMRDELQSMAASWKQKYGIQFAVPSELEIEGETDREFRLITTDEKLREALAELGAYEDIFTRLALSRSFLAPRLKRVVLVESIRVSGRGSVGEMFDPDQQALIVPVDLYDADGRRFEPSSWILFEDGKDAGVVHIQERVSVKEWARAHGVGHIVVPITADLEKLYAARLGGNGQFISSYSRENVGEFAAEFFALLYFDAALASRLDRELHDLITPDFPSLRTSSPTTPATTLETPGEDPEDPPPGAPVSPPTPPTQPSGGGVSEPEPRAGGTEEAGRSAAGSAEDSGAHLNRIGDVIDAIRRAP